MPDDYEVVFRQEPLKVQPVVELGKPRKDITLLDAIDYILNAKFDPATTSYEFPVIDQHPLTYDSLRALSSCNICEVSVNCLFDDDVWVSRVISGDKTACGTQSLLPLHSTYERAISGELVVQLKSPPGYPILDDAGVFTGQLWDVDIHNHPNTTYEGPPYPSMADVRNAATHAKTAILVTSYGMTVYSPLGTKLNMPPELGAKITAQTPDELSRDMGGMLEVSWYVDRHNLIPESDVQAKRVRWTGDKVLCDLVGVKVKVLAWEKDRKEIEKILTAVNDRTFDSQDYLSQHAEAPTPLPI